MAEATALSLVVPAALAAPPEELAREAWILDPPMPHEIPGVLRSEAALLIDRLLVRVARGKGALDVAIAERLGELSVGDRTLRIGYSGIGDYANERLGIAPRTGQQLARFGRGLRERPILREAVRRGEVSIRKAEVVLPVAVGNAEAEWVARARTETVRALESAVDAVRPAEAKEEAQTCAAGMLVVRAPESVGVLLAQTFRAVREVRCSSHRSCTDTIRWPSLRANPFGASWLPRIDMSETLAFLLLLGAWLVLQFVILPRYGEAS